MLWIIQENFKDEYNYNNLIESLNRQGSKYTTVTVIPFGHTLEPDIEPTNEMVFAVGATSLNKICKAKGFSPGYFDVNLTYDRLLQHYGKHMLNWGGEISTFDEARPKWDPFFIRPVNDGKQFSGQVMTLAEFDDWRKRVVALAVENSWVSLVGTDQVFCAPLTDIYEEYRFQVVGGKVITGSRYKRGSKVGYDSHVDASITDFAQKMVDIWQPNAAFVIDIAVVPRQFIICEKCRDGEPEPATAEWVKWDHDKCLSNDPNCYTPDAPATELKVIEINAINSAGFYACDMGKFVGSVEALCETALAFGGAGYFKQFENKKG